METEFKFHAETPNILEEANAEHGQAHALVEEGVISEGLGNYLKDRANMRSCLRIAEIFAKEADMHNSSLRLSEAASVLKGIISVYTQPQQYEAKLQLVNLAREEYVRSCNGCQEMLRGRN
jgi:hypothetical protein